MMFGFKIGLDDRSPKSILLIGAHCDDIEIGCGATILQLADKFPDAIFHWVVLSSNPVRAKEASASADIFLRGVRHKAVEIMGFRNGYFPYVGDQIKDYFETLKAKIDPDIIFTHFGQDYHQDHRVTSELTWNTFRDHLILEFEIPKYDGGMGSPNLFVPSSRKDCESKIDNLLRLFASESNKQWFTDSTFRGLMRLRGIECNAKEGYAEAFYCRKLVVSS